MQQKIPNDLWRSNVKPFNCALPLKYTAVGQAWGGCSKASSARSDASVLRVMAPASR